MHLAETQRQAEERETVTQNKKGKSRYVCLVEAVRQGRGRQTPLKWDVLCDWLGDSIWLSLAGPKLEAGAKIREAGSLGLCFDYLGPMVAEAVFWCPRLVATEAWVRVLLPYMIWPLSICIFSLSISSLVKWGWK